MLLLEDGIDVLQLLLLGGRIIPEPLVCRLQGVVLGEGGTQLATRLLLRCLQRQGGELDVWWFKAMV